ncbi:MAG: SPOR domain-containing protein [bacterium]
MFEKVKLHIPYSEDVCSLTFVFGRRTMASLVGFCILLPALVFSQTAKFDLVRLLQANDFEDVRIEVQKYIAKNRGTPTAMFLGGFIEPDAQKAVEKYKRLLTKYPDSEEADDALLKVAQYYYSRGLYISARKQYLRLVDHYPSSPYVDDAAYLSAACLFAAEKFETCRKELQDFILHYPRSSFVRVAREDLREIRLDKNLGLVSSRKLRSSNDNSKGKYTIQVAAFTQINNALKQRDFLLKSGLPVEIREKQSRHATVYLVWVGAFETKEAAKAFGENFKKEYGKPYRIVER